MSRWTIDKARDWYGKQPWLVGCNFLPSTAINQLEMWQGDTFDPDTIDRELGWAADMGTLYDTGFKGFKIAMVISNFGPDLKFIEEDCPLPMNFKFGGVFDIFRNENHTTTFSVEGCHPNDAMEKFNAGVEYWFRDMFSLRFGDHFEYDAGGISAGCGLRLSVSERRLNFDYGYHDMGLLESFHRFSVGLSF